MSTVLKLIITIPFVAALLWLCFANRAEISLVWSPLDEPVDIAIAVVILGAVIAGFIWGSLMTWINYAPVRREKSINRRARAELEKELSSVKAQVSVPSSTTSTPSVPATWNP